MDNKLSVNEWPLWELINPSDPYTFRAPDVRVAGVVACMLSPSYGAKLVNGDERSPMMIGWDQWCVKHVIDEVWIESHTHEIVEAFDSFLIGAVEDRAAADAFIAEFQTPIDARNWKLERQDLLRTSLSAIGEAAYSYADKMRRNLKEMVLEAEKVEGQS